jgi:hypothetical protein
LQFLEATKACVNLLGVAYSFRDRVFGIEGGFAANKRALWGSRAANKTESGRNFHIVISPFRAPLVTQTAAIFPSIPIYNKNH